MKFGHERIFLNLHLEGKKVDYQALANQTRLEIDFNNQKISSYLAYFIGLVSIFLAIYLFLLDNKLSLLYSVFYLLLFLGITLFLIYKIKQIVKKNEREIEGYMGIQAYLAGSRIFVLEGTKEGVKKIMEDMNKIPGIKKKDLMDILKKKENETTNTRK